MKRETGGYTPDIQTEKIHPLIQQYLASHTDLSVRERDFLIQYYKNLKMEMTARSAAVFKKEAARVKGQAQPGEFRKLWGSRDVNPEQGPNATTLFMGEVNDIQNTAARQAIELFEMRRHAEIDHLTGLYRGEAFDRYAEETLRAAQELSRESNRGKKEGERLVSAYVAFDVDNFKTVNDTIGHVAADRDILTPMGEILRGTPEKPGIIRSTDLGSRIGGDEFVVLFTQIRADAIAPTVERLLAAFKQITYKDKEGKDVPITVSAGVKVIENDERITLKQARHLADEAANVAKIEKNTFQIYTPDLRQRIERMIATDQDKALQFYIRQQRQANKRSLENIAQFNPDDLPDFEASIEAQARINLKTKLRQLEAQEKSA